MSSVLVCRLCEGTNNPCGARAAVAPSLQKAPNGGGRGTSPYFFRLPCWLAGHRPFAFRVRFVASHSTHHLPRTCVAPPVPWDVLAPWPCCLLAFRFGPLCPGTCSPRGRVACWLFALAPRLPPRARARDFGSPLCLGTCSPRGPASCSSPPTKGASSLLPCLLCYLTSVPLSLSPFFSQSDPPIQPPSVISS